MTRRQLDWINTSFITLVHLLALLAVVHLTLRFSWWTLGIGIAWFCLCGMSITAGYHRHFAHPTHKTARIIRTLYLAFGAASMQNSALKWASDHRRHHAFTDEARDPYNSQKGFWWSHIGWVLFKDDGEITGVRDLEADPLIRIQDRFHAPLGILVGWGLPAVPGLCWGDPLGAALVAGSLRLVAQWHATFSINSVAHKIGVQPYSTKSSARDSFVTALITFGEGYHNFHHRFQLDYRNGVRWFHFDPTKWWLATLSLFGLTWDLRRTPREVIRRARAEVLASRPAGAA